MKSDIHFKFDAPLNIKDTEEQTYGCRANNPNICRYYMLDDVCAFSSKDSICKKPSRSWKKQYGKLSEEKDGD